jgi:DNA-binding NtrC family response regulator
MMTDDMAGKPRIYKESDYDGEFNLKFSERQLIMKAAGRFKGHRLRMALKLGISVEALDYKIIQHSLSIEEL